MDSFSSSLLSLLLCYVASSVSFKILILRLKGGPFIKEMLEHFTFLIEKQTEVVNHVLEKKAKLLYVYSGHDTSIATILNSLNVFNGLAPPYASAVLLELFKREEGKHFVRIAYKNETEVGLFLIIIVVKVILISIK